MIKRTLKQTKKAILKTLEGKNRYYCEECHEKYGGVICNGKIICGDCWEKEERKENE